MHGNLHSRQAGSRGLESREVRPLAAINSTTATGYTRKCAPASSSSSSSSATCPLLLHNTCACALRVRPEDPLVVNTRNTGS
jgi:hypothetical protein